MTLAYQNQIVSAFTIGYFMSYLKEYLDENRNNIDDFKKSFIIEHSNEIKDTISELYEDVFNTKYSNNFTRDCIDEMKSSIEKVIDSTSQEISRREDAFLEIAYLSGSFLSVANTVLPEEFDIEKFELICSELINSLSLNIVWPEYEKLMSDLSSGTPNKKCNSRDELFLMISKNNAISKKIYGFQNLLNRISLHRAFEHIADAGMYFSSFMFLFSVG